MNCNQMQNVNKTKISCGMEAPAKFRVLGPCTEHPLISGKHSTSCLATMETHPGEDRGTQSQSAGKPDRSARRRGPREARRWTIMQQHQSCGCSASHKQLHPSGGLGLGSLLSVGQRFRKSRTTAGHQLLFNHNVRSDTDSLR